MILVSWGYEGVVVRLDPKSLRKILDQLDEDLTPSMQAKTPELADLIDKLEHALRGQ